jgi:putative hydrolase of the HAD superfamily
MKDKTAVFFDVGGVLLTNGWDHQSRRLASEKFSLDFEEFEAAHDKYADALDMGLIAVTTYLDKVLFEKPRDFSKAEFYEFMKSRSVANEEVIDIARQVSTQSKYLLSTINNESTDLNLYRIEKFGLGSIFKVFLSSCYLGVKKPDPAIFVRALLLTNKRPEETIFIDDRHNNLEAPRQLGMGTIEFTNAEQLVQALRSFDIDVHCNSNGSRHSP